MNESRTTAGRTIIRLEPRGDVALILVDNPPVNAGSRAVREGLLDALRAVAASSHYQGVVIMGAGNTFIAGSDLKEFEAPLVAPELPAVLDAIEACQKPVVAAIHGASLGGGYELALACDARIATASAVVGLPEVTLGIMPGAGGTQRLPRLIGAARAVEVICSGRRVRAPEALALGMIDRVAEGELEAAAIIYARELAGSKRRATGLTVPAETGEAFELVASEAARRGKGRPHVLAAIEAVRDSIRLPVRAALARERATFQSLRTSPEAAAMRHLFFAEREAARIPGVALPKPREIATVGVIGGGTMGAGIAACLLEAGCGVTLVEHAPAAAEAARGRIAANLERTLKAGKLDATGFAGCIDRLRMATQLETLSGAGLVIEAVFEDVAVKCELLARLATILPADTLIATNTSYLDFEALADASGRPDLFVGLHFFSPAQLMRLLEVVRGARTSAQSLADALGVAKRLRKLAIVAGVGEGFIGNRIYAAYRRQCEYLLEEGALPEDVDAAMEAFGFAMGPFAVADLSGLDIAWAMRKRQAATRDPRERYVDIADRLCEAGRFGHKAGAGWYRHVAGERRGQPDAFVRQLVEEASARRGLARQPLAVPFIQRRALLAMVNEAVQVVLTGIALRGSDVDLVLVNGFGFPAHEGGPLHWARREDRAALLRDLQAMADASGFGFSLASESQLQQVLG